MEIIKNKQRIKEIKSYMLLAFTETWKSTCQKSQRGVIIVQNNEIIGTGYNRPMLEDMCCLRETIKDNTGVELCNAIHAEQMAIINAVNDNKQLHGATMYHIKAKNGKMRKSGKPSCTVCSRMIHYAGLEFVIWHEEGYAIYGPEEFNKESFKYFLDE